MNDTLQEKILYIFIDESGDFNFSSKGSKNFYLTAFATFHPAENRDRLLHLKYKLLASGIDQEYFHATEDKQVVRGKVFDFVESLNDQYAVHAVFARKNKAHPALYEKFYSRQGKRRKYSTGAGIYTLCIRTLLRYIFRGKSYNYNIDKIVVVVASVSFGKKLNNKKIINEEIKHFLKLEIPNKPFQIYCHTMKSDINRQLADYCCWAFSLKYERGENRPYDIIKKQVKNEFDIFKRGTVEYY